MTHRIGNDDNDPIIGPPTDIDWDALIPPATLWEKTRQTILIMIIVFTMVIFWGTFIAGINALWIN